jgi:hypothetical protein
VSSASWFCEKSETFSTLSSYFQTASRSPRESSSTRCSLARETSCPSSRFSAGVRPPNSIAVPAKPERARLQPSRSADECHFRRPQSCRAGCWNEVPVRVLHRKFHGDHSARGIEMNFCFLLALFTAERAERTSDLESGLVRWLLA